MDPFSDQVAYIGARATGGRGGRFWIVGLEHSPDDPEDVTPIALKTNDLWMLGRVFVAGAGAPVSDPCTSGGACEIATSFLN